MRLGVMIEGQEGLSWTQWNAIVDTVQRLGFDSLWRSDHLLSVMGPTERDVLALWPSLTTAALQSTGIELGALVSPITFRNPVSLALDSVALDHLSGGRFWLGIGAGWNEREHRAYGFDLPAVGERMDRLEEALKVIRLLWTGDVVSFHGRYYQLNDAQARPTPTRGDRVPIVIGGRGKRRLLRLVAEYADEWNVVTMPLNDFQVTNEALLRHCEAIGRDPAGIQRSWMLTFLVGRNQSELQRRAARLGEIAQSYRGLSPDTTLEQARARGLVVGTPEEIVADLKRREVLGVERVQLQLLDYDDLDALELIAREVMPYV